MAHCVFRRNEIPPILANAIVILAQNCVPSKLRVGRTILIYKGKGLEMDQQNWRPITIISIIHRHIIERWIDQIIRDRIHFSQLQKRFVKGLSGVHIKASIVDGCLKFAIKRKQGIVMLGLSEAFDRVGHNHVKNTFKFLTLQTEVMNLTSTWVTTNLAKIKINKIKSKKPNYYVT